MTLANYDLIQAKCYFITFQVAPITIHPTIDKAAHYFGLEVIHTPVDSNYKADVKAMENVTCTYGQRHAKRDFGHMQKV